MTAPHAPLLAIHRALEAALATLRELVLAGDDVHAAAVLATYRALTERHAAAEDAALVPRLPVHARWPAELYLGQHAKLLAGLDRAAPRIADLRGGTPGWRARALAALDALAPVHHLVEHHHQAEEQDLFPVVAALAPAAVTEVVRAWDDAWAVHAPVLGAARAALAARP